MALLAPGARAALFGGLPLSPAGVVVAALAVYAALALPRLTGRAVYWILGAFALALLLKGALAWVAAPYGLTARYWAGSDAAGAPERSTEFLALRDATRVDDTLDLRGNRFPVHFFNDAARFNTLGADAAPRDQLPFTVRWNGTLLVPSDGERRVRLEAIGAAAVSLDGRQALRLDGQLEGRRQVEGRIPLTAGAHLLQVEYARPAGRIPDLRVSWEATPGEALRPISAPSVVREGAPRPVGAFGLLAASPLLRGMADVLVAGPVLAWLALGLRALRRAPAARPRALLGALPLLFLAQGIAQHWDLVGRATILSAGDDWLAYYEGPARDILLNGPLMMEGKENPGPYFQQPLYPYALAAAHALTGESLFGPLALQFAGLGLLLLGTSRLAARLFGWEGGLAALALFWAFLQQEHLRIARTLLTENLYMPLVVASLIALAALAQRKTPASPWRTALVGVLLGATALARSQVLLFVPLALLILWLGWRRAGQLRTALALLALLAGLAAAIAPATVRNYVVSGKPILISSSSGLNLVAGSHAPPPDLRLDGIDSNPLYERLALDRETRIVLEYARQQPARYAGTWLTNGLYSVGFTGVRRGDFAPYWGFLLTALLYVAAVLLLPAARRRPVWLVHGFVASHLLVMMAFEADAYGLRQPAPMYAPMVAVAAQLPLAALRRALSGWRGGGIRGHSFSGRALVQSVAAIAALLAGVQQARGLAELLPGRDALYHGLPGPAALAARVANEEQADVVYVASSTGTPRLFGAGNLPGLAYPRFKWFDPSRSVPLPPEGTRAVYDLWEVDGPNASARGVTECLGRANADGILSLTAESAAARCLPASFSADGWRPLNARFGDSVQVDAVRTPGRVAAGERFQAELVWRPLRRVREPVEAFLHALEDDPRAEPVPWANGTAQLYPASQWEPGERVLSRLRVESDPTAWPGVYRLTLGFVPAGGRGTPLLARFDGGSGDRAPAGMLLLDDPPAADPFVPPPGVRVFEKPVRGGGLELVAARPPQETARPGDRLRTSLIWRVAGPRVTASQVRLTLTRGDGRIVQEAVLPLLHGKRAPGPLPVGRFVRDEQGFVVSARAPDEPLRVRWQLLDTANRPLSDAAADDRELGTVVVEGRQRSFALQRPPSTRQPASFGGSIQLLGYDLPPTARPGTTVTLTLSWRTLAEMDTAYTVFAQVLDPTESKVVAQRDSEPKGGQLPTTGWLTDEVIEGDDYTIQLPPDLPDGEYPVQVGLYDAASGQRLLRAHGESRVLLETRLRVAR